MDWLEQIKETDTNLLLIINGAHTNLLDSVMLFFSDRYVWIPLYVGLVAYCIVKLKREALYTLLTLVAAIIASDLIASSIFKPLVQRLRPCHNMELQEILYIIEGVCGGKYGFVSSHAANTFALATFILLVFPKQRMFYSLFCWAFFVSFSRVYLAVHYPLDVLVGAMVGVFSAFFFYYLLTFLRKKIIS